MWRRVLAFLDRIDTPGPDVEGEHPLADFAAASERARQLEGLGYLGISLQQPLGLDFQSACNLIS